MVLRAAGFPTGQLLSLGCSLRLQIAQSRSYLHTLGPIVDITYILGALGIVDSFCTIQYYTLRSHFVSYHIILKCIM